MDELGFSGPYENVVTYRIRFKPSKEVFLKGIDPAVLIENINGLGGHTVRARMDEIPLLNDLNPQFCYTQWDIILTTTQGINSIEDAFHTLGEESAVKIDIIDEGGVLDFEEGYKKLGEILVDRGEISSEKLTEIVSEQKRLGEVLQEEHLVMSDELESALAEQEYMRRLKVNLHRNPQIFKARLPSGSFDDLLELARQLNSLHKDLSRCVENKDSEPLGSLTERLESIVSMLHDRLLNLKEQHDT